MTTNGIVMTIADVLLQRVSCNMPCIFSRGMGWIKASNNDHMMYLLRCNL